MKKKLIIVIGIVVVLLVVGIFANKRKSTENPNWKRPVATNFESTEGITTVLTLEDEIQNDTVWCGTFQLIWNDLKNDLAKQDIKFTPQLEVVENLNKETFKESDISEEYYYKKVDHPSIALKKEIEQAIKINFNETSDILDDFNWEARNADDYFLYAMLKKEFQFEKAFQEFEKGKFKDYENVSYFGIKDEQEAEVLRNQVEVLYYNSDEDFAIKLKTKQEDEVILCKNPQGSTFNEIYKNVLERANNYQGEKTLEDEEYIKIPNIKLKEKNDFTEIENKKFLFSNGNEYVIEKAIQTIDFELDKTGGKIKSEAGMMANTMSAMKPMKPRQFFLDDTFAIFLIESGKENPYFAGKIDDITKFQ